MASSDWVQAVFIAALSAFAMSGPPPAIAAGLPVALESAGQFTTQGLNYETELTALYLGDFAHARLQRVSAEFVTLYTRYLETFSRQCAAFLPADKVPITKRECSVESYSTNRYGVRTGVSSCVRYEEVPTGFYAAPDMYRAKIDLDTTYERDMLKNALHGGIPQAMTGGIDAVTGLGSDLATLLRTNTCDGKATRRFQDNLLRFANGQEGLRLPGEPTLASLRPRAATAVGATDASVAKLVTNLVADNAQGWLMNRYVAGSVDEVHVTRRDTQGRPALAEGYYLYEGGSGRKVGKLRLEFVEGTPRCLYFADAPGTCRNPSRRVVTAFEKGSYEK